MVSLGYFQLSLYRSDCKNKPSQVVKPNSLLGKHVLYINELIYSIALASFILDMLLMQFPVCTQVFPSSQNIISIQYVIITWLALPAINIIINMSISYICQIFLHYFLTCFPITTNSSQSHTQLPFTKVCCWPIFFWALTTDTQRESSLGSNQSVIIAEQHSPHPSKKKSHKIDLAVFFCWFLGSHAKGCAIYLVLPKKD